jgi:anti-sigma factor RsiW
MNHQPFETWILDERTFTPEERTQFEKHLATCPRCARLQASWQKAHHQIVTTPMRHAPGNFLSQWQSNLVLFKERQKRKQAHTLLYSFIAAAVLALIALGAVLLPKISLISVIVVTSSAIVRLIEFIKEIWTVALSLLRVAPTTMIIVISAMLAGWILLAVLAWGASVWKVSVKKVVNK